jgi:hypothetical protein
MQSFLYILFQQRHKSKKDIPIDDCARIIAFLADNGVKEIDILGGANPPSSFYPDNGTHLSEEFKSLYQFKRMECSPSGENITNI